MRFAIIIVAAVAGVASLWLLPSPGGGRLDVSGFVEADAIRIGSRIGGRVAEVFAAEGDRLKTGAPVFRLEPYKLIEELKSADATSAAAEAELARLKAGSRPEEIAVAAAEFDRRKAVLKRLSDGARPLEVAEAKALLSLTKAVMDFCVSYNARIVKLGPSHAVASYELDLTRCGVESSVAAVDYSSNYLKLLEEGSRAEDIAEAKAAADSAEASLALLKAGSRKEDIARAAAQADAARANAEAVRKSIDELLVKAPCDCLVESINLRPGDIVPSNAPAASLLDTSRLRIRAYIPEGLLAIVPLGAKVPIRLDAFPGRTFLGTVSFVATQGEFTPRNIQTPEERSKQVFRVKVDLAPGQDGPRAGMVGDLLLGSQAK